MNENVDMTGGRYHRHGRKRRFNQDEGSFFLSIGLHAPDFHSWSRLAVVQIDGSESHFVSLALTPGRKFKIAVSFVELLNK